MCRRRPLSEPKGWPLPLQGTHLSALNGPTARETRRSAVEWGRSGADRSFSAPDWRNDGVRRAVRYADCLAVGRGRPHHAFHHAGVLLQVRQNDGADVENNDPDFMGADVLLVCEIGVERHQDRERRLARRRSSSSPKASQPRYAAVSTSHVFSSWRNGRGKLLSRRTFVQRPSRRSHRP